MPAAEVIGMLDHLSDGIVVLGYDWRFRYLNEPAAEMLGRSLDELMGSHIWSKFPESVDQEFHHACEEAMRTKTPQRVSQYFESFDRWFQNQIFPQADGLLIVLKDATDERRAAGELRDYAERMEEAERIAHFGVWEWEIPTGTVRWSKELHRIYGLAEGEFGGTVDAFLSHLHPDDHGRVGAAIERAIKTLEPFEFEERIIRPSGEERILFSQGRAIAGPNGEAEALVGVCHDVTEGLAAQRALDANKRRTRAIIDNLPSIVTVKDSDGRYLMANSEFAGLLSLSDEEVVGSECAALFPEEIATRFQANDQRAVLDGEAVYDEVLLIREGERRTFETVTFPLPDHGSAGEVCTIATDITDRPERESERSERLEWERIIGSAVNEGRVAVYGQPVVDLATGEPTSWELLVRILADDESGSLIEAADFVPAAERFGLIQEIDEWMVRQALGLAADRMVQVNLSAVTLCDLNACRRIHDLVAAEPQHASNVVFEITETIVADFIDSVCTFADDVTDLGCGLALDDFGTGFGSFTYLHKLPLDYLKVDMSFVIGMLHSDVDQRVVKTIIGIAEQFGLKTIVEGVENEETLELLRDFGAGYVQGYHLGRPAPIDSF